MTGHDVKKRGDDNATDTVSVPYWSATRFVLRLRQGYCQEKEVIIHVLGL